MFFHPDTDLKCTIFTVKSVLIQYTVYFCDARSRKSSYTPSRVCFGALPHRHRLFDSEDESAKGRTAFTIRPIARVQMQASCSQ